MDGWLDRCRDGGDVGGGGLQPDVICCSKKLSLAHKGVDDGIIYLI